jgi:hypothetical protein
MGNTTYIDGAFGAKMIARPQRFPIQAIMHYRVIGEERWFVGTVDNMSSTGVLFHGERFVGVDSSVEVTVNIPGSLAAGHSSKMVSRGRIVRVSRDEVEPGYAVMAAELYHLRILRD